jgi:hypothetical protein
MTSQEKEKEFSIPEGLTIPDEFYKIMQDFILDIQNTFPEYNGIIGKWWKADSEFDKNRMEKQKLFLFKHCIKTFPERFFDILYKNNEIFTESSDINTEFLPGVVFKQLWNCEITESTKETIWKYLQLILFSVIGSVHDKSQFGDTSKLFESINEEEWKTKLQETLEGMQNLFKNQTDTDTDNNSNNSDTGTGTGSNTNFNPNTSLPNAEDIQNHIHEMMEGKLGKLAMELAEETAQELNIDMENVTNSQDVFKKLFANPGKLMNMVKNVGGKIDEKIKSGEIKESELISEGVDMLNKMKSMPGMENMQEMFSKLGIPGLGKGAKLNTGAMEAQMNKNLKMSQMKERMKMKAEQKKNAKTENVVVENKEPLLTEEELISIFSTGEKVEKSMRNDKPSGQNKKKKNKK